MVDGMNSHRTNNMLTKFHDSLKCVRLNKTELIRVYILKSDPASPNNCALDEPTHPRPFLISFKHPHLKRFKFGKLEN